MGIYIRKPKSKTRECQCCHSNEKVEEIDFRTEDAGVGQGTVVALCHECRKELTLLLDNECLLSHAEGKSNYVEE